VSALVFCKVWLLCFRLDMRPVEQGGQSDSGSQKTKVRSGCTPMVGDMTVARRSMYHRDASTCRDESS